MANASMLELQNVAKTYGTGALMTRVLTDVNLTIHPGEMVAIMGPSGSGKSTLLNLLGCLDTVSAGQYRLGGRTVSGLNHKALARLRNEVFGFVFQFFGLITEYTAWENVMVPLLYRGVDRSVARRTAMEMLEQVGIGALREKRPDQLSGGQQQRVAIARALVGEPQVILADEPTGSLDSATGVEVMNLLHDRNRRGHTVIIVTHSPDVSARCSRVINIRDGGISSPVHLQNQQADVSRP